MAQESDHDEPPPMAVTDPQTRKEYRMKDVIGASHGATVYEADESHESDKPTAVAVAVKILNINNKNDSYWDLKYDILSSKSLPHHPNVVEIKASFTVNDNCLCVVMPFMTLGSLQTVISSSRFKNGFSEDCVAIILTETLKGLAHIHKNRHTHKNLSAKNIFLCQSGAVKLAYAASGFDYGQNPGTKLLEWPAPEVGRYCTTMSDIWLVGVTALQLAYGLRVSTRQGMLGMIRKYSKETEKEKEKVGLDSSSSEGGKNEDEFEERKLSRSFQDVVGLCLAREQLDRPTATELLNHDFFNNRRRDVLYLFNAINPEKNVNVSGRKA